MKGTRAGMIMRQGMRQRTRRLALAIGLAGAVGLGACAAPDKLGGGASGAGDKFATTGGGGAGTATGPSASVATVVAFGRICSRLDRQEALSRAVSFGFVPVDVNRLRGNPAAEMLRQPGVALMARATPGAAPSVLLWTDAGPSCELAAGGIDPAVVEREFASMLGQLEQQQQLSVTPIGPEADRQAGPMRLRTAAVIAPRAGLAVPPRALSLRVNEDPSQSLQVTLIARVIRPGGSPGLASAGSLGGAPKQ